jgi:3',5'-cyclic AMP phosphodiesterase CpdA
VGTPAPAFGQNGLMTTLLAHISDLHLDGGERARTRATRVMDHLRGLPRPVDALLVTGDIADHGAASEYEQAAEVLAAPFPVLTCPGNHDNRAAYRTGLRGQPASDGPINEVHHVAGTAILMCDATIPGRNEGRLTASTIAWIDSTLIELPPEMPALIAFHQPPIELHHPVLDSMLLQDPEELAELLDEYPNVVAVLAGHAHTPAATMFAGRPLLVGPAVTWTMRLPWEGEPLANLEAPPGLAFHVLGNGRLTTHYRVVV